eukprot:TRINITY_DN42148_c0_g1_i1.p1 TRINITY_DN42148_c0_g1~~TRINITY_DN42148_c0_g1_i1.p1  ORF type:complete len:451 (+),score=88.55 TRINITY_DN42148_c0_g1_i1:82-1434(+)
MPLMPRRSRRSEAAHLSQRELRTTVFSRTKMCKFYLLGTCTKGDNCSFAHNSLDLEALPDLQRTKLCKTLINTGACNDESCMYAHNKQELRIVPGFCADGRIPPAVPNRRRWNSAVKQSGGDGGSRAGCATGDVPATRSNLSPQNGPKTVSLSELTRGGPGQVATYDRRQPSQGDPSKVAEVAAVQSMGMDIIAQMAMYQIGQAAQIHAAEAMRLQAIAASVHANVLQQRAFVASAHANAAQQKAAVAAGEDEPRRRRTTENQAAVAASEDEPRRRGAMESQADGIDISGKNASSVVNDFSDGVIDVVGRGSVDGDGAGEKDSVGNVLKFKLSNEPLQIQRGSGLASLSCASLVTLDPWDEANVEETHPAKKLQHQVLKKRSQALTSVGMDSQEDFHNAITFPTFSNASNIGVTVKNTFLDFGEKDDTPSALRAVHTAAGRLDLMVQDDD